MKIEKKASVVSIVAGVISGIVSDYLNTMYAVGLAIGAYLILFFLIRKFVRVRKLEWYFSNTAIYFLVWFILWILLFNQ